MNHIEFKKKHAELVDNNNHTEAAELLVNAYGTLDEKLTIWFIKNRHERAGHISESDQELRDGITGKYRKFE